MVTLDVTGLDDSDVKSSKGWKKNYKITLAGMLNGVNISVSLRSDDLDAMEEIVPFDTKAQRSITIEPVNHTLSSFSGAPAQISLTAEQAEDEQQDEELRQLRRELAEADIEKDQDLQRQ